ncbi:MAG: class III poly(R)-hydroxyalkanoic acid synthase subunit PhaC [Planctomycetota bacterium]
MNSLFETALEMQKSTMNEGLKMWSRVLTAAKVPEMASKVVVGNTPADVVHEESAFKLLRYRNPHSVDLAEPILVCYALVNRPYILDLQPDRSVVRQLLKRGFDVYMIDWTVPKDSDRGLRLYDYVCNFIKTAADVTLEKSKASKLNLLGYCMGGAMSTMFTALHPEIVRNLILLAAPIDFSGEDCLLHLWTQEKNFDVDALIDAYGNCPAEFLQHSFQLMKPVQNYFEKYNGFFENMYDENFLGNFFAMERWGNDNVPVAGETFREFCKCLYQRNQLVKGEFRLNGMPVDLKKITCPLLLLAATGDHLVSPSSTFGIEPHVGSSEVKKMTINAGHVGLVVSSKAHKQLWPDAAMWIADHSTVVRG